MSKTFVKIDPSSGNEVDKILYENFLPTFRKGYMEIGEKKWILPFGYEDHYEELDNFEVREDDVYVISHPKTGTTWTQEMVWCIGNDLDYKGAETCLSKRFPFLEVASLFEADDKMEETFDDCILDPVKYVNSMKSPRYIKTHLPWDLLPKQIQTGEKKPKIVYVARNAKDTCTSYFHHCRMGEGYTGDFEQFTKLFIGNRVCYTPFWTHIIDFWNLRDKENILFITYEDMKRDLPTVIRKVAGFLGKEYTDTEVDVLAKHLSFESMKNNNAVNYESFKSKEREEAIQRIDTDEQNKKFMRAGIVGSYKVEMTPEMIEKFDKWSEEHLRDTGLSFE